MRRWLVAGMVGLTACGRHGGRCDQVALAATAEHVQATLAAWRPELGVPPNFRAGLDGLWAACPTLPGEFHVFDDTVHPVPPVRGGPESAQLWQDVAVTRPLAAHCPDWRAVFVLPATVASEERAGAVFAGCRFAELGVLTAKELRPSDSWADLAFGHALYLWLVADGAPPAVARTLVRPLIAGADWILTGHSHGWGPLPAVGSGGVPRALIRELRVSRTEANFEMGQGTIRLTRGLLAGDEWERVAQLRGLGGAIERVVEREREAAAEGRPAAPLELAIDADPAAPWATVGELATLAVAAGFTRIEARAFGPDPLRPVVGLSLFESGEAPVSTLHVEGERLTLTCEGEARTPALGALGAAARACGPLRLGAAPETPWQRIVAVLAELRGSAAIAEIVAPARGAGRDGRVP